MKELPLNIASYKSTPVFDQDSIPKALLKDHSTKPGTWGKINVIKGKLLYTIQTEPPEELLLSEQRYGVVEPEVLHKVSPRGKVEFFVEFMK
ncbi:MAG: DUF1971 domain-containing protein [Bacteriovoracaceae bacterium]|nr:DUF1971 domain-containing protein [Bacteriovoracaceae bacterium]